MRNASPLPLDAKRHPTRWNRPIGRSVGCDDLGHVRFSKITEVEQREAGRSEFDFWNFDFELLENGSYNVFLILAAVLVYPELHFCVVKIPEIWF